MSMIKDYYPFILYSIPYVIAAYVLIRAKRQRVREAREAAIREFRIAEVAEPPKSASRLGSRSITRMFQKIVTRKAA